MTRTTPSNLKEHVHALVQKHRGAWLQSRTNSVGPHRAPLREFPLGTVTKAALQEDFPGVISWAGAWLEPFPHGQVNWQSKDMGMFGTHLLPLSVTFDNLHEVTKFSGDHSTWELLCSRQNELQAKLGRPDAHLAPWCDDIASLSALNWKALLACLVYFNSHRNCGLFIRQLPIEGVDTKWIESHEALLTSMLSILFGEAGTLHTLTGMRKMPDRVRLLILCPELRKHTAGLRDVELPLQEIASSSLRPSHVLVVENQECGLQLPDMPGTVAFVKLGYKVSALNTIPWLAGLPGWYWGDLDTHGFAILNQARHALPRLESILMTESVLLDHATMWVPEPSPAKADPDKLTLLTPAERAVYAGLQAQVYGKNVRLEQERIGWNFVAEALEKLAH